MSETTRRSRAKPVAPPEPGPDQPALLPRRYVLRHPHAGEHIATADTLGQAIAEAVMRRGGDPAGWVEAE
jgi:hypothetical protein